MVNNARKMNSLCEIDLIFVDMILVEENCQSDSKFSNKASSTHIREHLSRKDEENNTTESSKDDNLI
jgi:hypothetical protein